MNKMNLEYVIKKITGKTNFELSPSIPKSYIINQGITYVVGMVRGFFRKFGFYVCGKKLFLGKKVKLRVKNKISLGNSVRIESGTIINALSEDGVIVGNQSKFGKNNTVQVTGSLSHLGKGLIVGNNTSFAENTYFGAAGGIKIGNDVIVGQNVRFHAENHKYDNPQKLIREQGVSHKGIFIGNNVWIGSGAVFLDGSYVGDNSVVAANAVVTGSFNCNSIIGGVPAKIIKSNGV